MKRWTGWLLAVWIAGVILIGASFGAVLPAGHWQAAFRISLAGFWLALMSLIAFVWTMLVDCLRRPFTSEGRRLGYLALILLLAPWGAIAYFFMVGRRGREETNLPDSNP